MPGLSLIFSKGDLLKKRELIENSLNSNNHLENFSSKIYLLNENLFIGWNDYPEYPIELIEEDSLAIIIEGKIYNKSKGLVISELTKIIKNINHDDRRDEFRSWVLDTDGDFILGIRDKNTKNFYLLNDIFGRLPIYFKIVKDGIIISRHLKFIKQVAKEFDFDKVGLSQFLLFGYMLGERTLLQNVNHLRPATLLLIENFNVKKDIIHNFNFQIRNHTNVSLDENINNLANLFSKATINRLNNYKKNVIALSGGLDSRLIAACMYKNNIPFDVSTISYKNGYGVEEIEVAQILSKIFNSKFNLFEIGPAIGRDIYELLRIKEGMNSLATAPMLQFYRMVKDFFGSEVNFITGDNGDKHIFTIDRPLKDFKSIEGLSDYIIDENSIIDIDIVSSIIGMDKNIFKDELINILKSFPEEDLTQKYLHFRIIEKPFKYAFQGEDRHRNYFWHLTPFWSIQFFNYIMNCSDEVKIKHQLFGSLIKKYSHKAIQLPYTNFKSSVTSFKGKVFMNLVYHAYPNIPTKLKKRFKDGFFGSNSKIRNDAVLSVCIKNAVEGSDIISKYLNLNDDVLKKFRKVILYNILTITSAIEDFNGIDPFKKFLDEDF